MAGGIRASKVAEFLTLTCRSFKFLALKKDLSSDLHELRRCGVKSLTSEATPLATQFFKKSYKISNNPGLQVSLDALPSFAVRSKIGQDFTI